MSYSITVRTDPYCNCYHFEFFPKGFQVRYEKDNNTTRQTIPYTSLLSHRLDYIYDDKVHVISLFLKDSIKYTYCFKSCGDAERVYESIRDGCLGSTMSL